MPRTHIVLDEETLEAVDRIAGPRGRSKFIEEAVRSRVEQLELLAELEVAGPLIDVDAHPEWATSEDVAAWVRSVRAEVR
jgi:metal-responsive CopG/Arc/MetJ family transcriptional regulator